MAPISHRLVWNVRNERNLNFISFMFFEKIPVIGRTPKTCAIANTRKVKLLNFKYSHRKLFSAYLEQ